MFLDDGLVNSEFSKPNRHRTVWCRSRFRASVIKAHGPLPSSGVGPLDDTILKAFVLHQSQRLVAALIQPRIALYVSADKNMSCSPYSSAAHRFDCRRSRLHGYVARGAEEVAKIIYPDNLKAMRTVIHVEIQRIFVFCRKHGFAHLSAMRTSNDFNPAIAGHSPYAPSTTIVPVRTGMLPSSASFIRISYQQAGAK
jgi:hypothetical protein